MSYKDNLASNQHQQARTANASKSSRNLITSTQKPMAVNAVAEVPVRGKMDSADVTMSLGNHAEDGFITVTKKKHGDIGAVKSSKNNKTGRNFRAPKYGCVILHPFLLFLKGSKLKLCLFHVPPQKFPHVMLRTP
jgi:hypothetical protein